jgi:hypothetical protein
MTSRESGVSVIETLLVLLLLSVLVPGAWAVVARHHTAAVGTAHRAEALETIRTAAWILPQELSGGLPGRDWWMGGDSVALRAFRGLGLVKGGSVQGQELLACVRGIRMPNPEKDSVLLLGADGRWRAHELQGRVRVADTCPGVEGGWEERWTLSPDPARAVLGRIFERGSYHLSGGALRYRRGAGGRQPLTPERLEAGQFSGEVVGEAGDETFFWEVTLSEPPGRAESLGWRGILW